MTLKQLSDSSSIPVGTLSEIERYRRTLARNDEVAVQRLDRLLDRLWPNGGPQERTLGLPWFAARYGLEALARAVVAEADPCDEKGARLRDLRP